MSSHWLCQNGFSLYFFCGSIHFCLLLIIFVFQFYWFLVFQIFSNCHYSFLQPCKWFCVQVNVMILIFHLFLSIIVLLSTMFLTSSAYLLVELHPNHIISLSTSIINMCYIQCQMYSTILQPVSLYFYQIHTNNNPLLTQF